MRHPILFTFFLLTGAVSAMGQAKVDIVSPQVRMNSINRIKTLLTTKVIEDSPEDLAKSNPFNPLQPVDPVAAVEPTAALTSMGPGGDQEKLQKIANGVIPTGTMKLGDTPILLFGQKKFKVGDTLPIIFEGASYELHITAIERISFTLRLNNEEITRPIKPVATKP